MFISLAYSEEITAFKGTSITFSTVKYNQPVTWYQITAGLLVRLSENKGGIRISPTELIIDSVNYSQQGKSKFV